MKKNFLLLSFLFFISQFLAAQKKELWVKKSDKGLFLEHKVVPKESFYSVGRLYNVAPKELADFNKLDINKGLFIDQTIKIPLTGENFDQTGNSGAPVYYKVGSNEGLMSVSNENNHVLLTKLRDWNSLTDDKLTPGMKMIIGFVQSKELPSVTIKVKPGKETAPIVKKEEEKPKDDMTTVTSTKEDSNEGKMEEKKEEKKPAPAVVQKEVKGGLSEQGYFKSFFDQQSKVIPPTRNETVSAGIFKTTSGWQDTKYYMLMDQVSPGTIVKITNPENNKAIYAKVLGQMSGIRQNEGYDIRISNAGASALEISDGEKFIVSIHY